MLFSYEKGAGNGLKSNRQKRRDKHKGGGGNNHWNNNNNGGNNRNRNRNNRNNNFNRKRNRDNDQGWESLSYTDFPNSPYDPKETQNSKMRQVNNSRLYERNLLKKQDNQMKGKGRKPDTRIIYGLGIFMNELHNEHYPDICYGGKVEQDHLFTELDAEFHFGTPFMTDVEGMRYKQATGVQVETYGTIGDAVKCYEQWLNGEAYQDIEPERLRSIIESIDDGTYDSTFFIEPRLTGNRNARTYLDVLIKFINDRVEDNNVNFM